MPNRAAKARKQEKAKKNNHLAKTGRTPNQIARELKRKLMREERLKQRKRV